MKTDETRGARDSRLGEQHPHAVRRRGPPDPRGPGPPLRSAPPRPQGPGGPEVAGKLRVPPGLRPAGARDPCGPSPPPVLPGPHSGAGGGDTLASGRGGLLPKPEPTPHPGRASLPPAPLNAPATRTFSSWRTLPGAGRGSPGPTPHSTERSNRRPGQLARDCRRVSR